MPDFLHNHKNFKDLLLILEQEKGIVSALLEKDYWIMHVLYGLQKAGFSFELKGGTSLSKGFGIINRFSEDIDIRINPPPELHVNETGSKKSHIASRFEFYDWLSSNLSIVFCSKKQFKTFSIRKIIQDIKKKDSQPKIKS